MAEYIEREAALDIVNGWREQLIPTYGENDEYVKCLETVAEHLKTLHAADVVERKTGRWCADYDGYSDGEPVYDMWWCSACGEYFDEWDDRPTWKYCPNCGTKMSGGDEDEEPQKEET